MNILVQLFWICLVVLESDYEHEFLLGLRLLEKVLSKLPLDRPDVREKIEKLQVATMCMYLEKCTLSHRYHAIVLYFSLNLSGRTSLEYTPSC